MSRQCGAFIVVLVLAAMNATCGSAAQNEPTRGVAAVELRHSTDRGWQLFRGGKPYFIQGAGGSRSLQLLVDCGGNSIRTWGADEGLQRQLDEAHRLGLSVTVGIWLGHERH